MHTHTARGVRDRDSVRYESTFEPILDVRAQDSISHYQEYWLPPMQGGCIVTGPESWIYASLFRYPFVFPATHHIHAS